MSLPLSFGNSSNRERGKACRHQTASPCPRAPPTENSFFFPVKGTYSLSRSAQRDIEDIRRYTLERHGATQVEIYLGGLRQQLEFIARFARIGHPVPGSALRMSPFEHHRIFYREASQGIRIERILHERRDLVGEVQRLIDSSDR